MLHMARQPKTHLKINFLFLDTRHNSKLNPNKKIVKKVTAITIITVVVVLSLELSLLVFSVLVGVTVLAIIGAQYSSLPGM